jgi:serine phosphatase RsbU (regulator of sigma subunit)
MKKQLLIAILFLISVAATLNSNGQAFDFSPDQAAEYQAAAFKHFQEGNFTEASRRFNNLGFFYWENNKFKDAINIFKESVKANEKIGNVNAIRHIYSNIGQIYYELQDFDASIDYQKKGLEIARSQKRRAEIASSLINLATTKTEKGLNQKAINNLEEALQIATELNEMVVLRSCYVLLAKNHDAIGNSEKAREYYNLFALIERRIQEEQAKKTKEEASKIVEQAQAEKQATAHELTERQKELVSTRQTLQEVEQVSREKQLQIDLMEQEQLLQEEQRRRQKLLRNTLISGSAFVAIFALLILYSLLEKRRANKKLAKQNAEISQQRDQISIKNKELESAYTKIFKQNEKITDSIAYAQRIQEALLPGEDNFQNYFNDSFIFFKPRDIVSGDFYWFRKVTSKDSSEYENAIIVAAVDCTGHGVPGAFMSMISINLLENITRRGIIKPASVLNELHKTIRKSLKQYKNDNRDGMEMSIAVIREDGKLLEFAGAKNPLLYISDKKIHTIKGDPAPIGGLQLEEERVFTNHQIIIKKPTAFYLFSDGYPDQFGGPEGNKFSTKRLKGFLEQNNKKPMVEQKALIDQEYKNWISDTYKQVDDLLIVGFRLNP